MPRASKAQQGLWQDAFFELLGPCLGTPATSTLATMHHQEVPNTYNNPGIALKKLGNFL
jgi:hypothetical protein